MYIVLVLGIAHNRHST